MHSRERVSLRHWRTYLTDSVKADAQIERLGRTLPTAPKAHHGETDVTRCHMTNEALFRRCNVSHYRCRRRRKPVSQRTTKRAHHLCKSLKRATVDQSLFEPMPSLLNDDIGIWTRGIDRSIFHPGARDLAWRREQGIADDEVVISFLGRLVMEKGLDVFTDSIIELRKRQVPHRVMVIGDGPARGWFEKALPGGIFVGQQEGTDLGRAVASADVFFNPSITETFGNVTLEHMACAIPVVAANATGSSSLVADGETGALVTPGDVEGFADALAPYCTDADLRARHGAAGLERSQPYTWEAINASMVDTYLRLANAREKNGGPQAARSA